MGIPDCVDSVDQRVELRHGRCVVRRALRRLGHDILQLSYGCEIHARLCRVGNGRLESLKSRVHVGTIAALRQGFDRFIQSVDIFGDIHLFHLCGRDEAALRLSQLVQSALQRFNALRRIHLLQIRLRDEIALHEVEIARRNVRAPILQRLDCVK